MILPPALTNFAALTDRKPKSPVERRNGFSGCFPPPAPHIAPDGQNFALPATFPVRTKPQITTVAAQGAAVSACTTGKGIRTPEKGVMCLYGDFCELRGPVSSCAHTAPYRNIHARGGISWFT